MKKAALSYHSYWWFTGFWVLLALLPLPFGTNRPWASDLFGMLSAVLLLGLLWDLQSSALKWPTGAPWRRIGASAGGLALVLFWAFLQTQSWTPSDWHHPLWQKVQSLPQAKTGSISIEPDQFPESLLRLLSYIVCFLLAFFGGRDPARAMTILKTLAIAGTLYALYGMLVQSTGWRMILWYDKWAYQDFVTSTFVNKNSYATYASIGLQCCLLLFWENLKQFPSTVTRLEQFGRQSLIYLIMSLIILAALVMTGSRAGLSSGLVGCLVLALSLAINRRWPMHRWAMLLAIGTVLTAGFMVSTNSLTLDRLDQNQISVDAGARLAAYKISLSAIHDNPWLGFGLGSFENAFRLYRNSTQPLWFQHAHNDYLEMIVELGIPAAVMLFLSLLLLISCCTDGIWRRKKREIFPILAFSTTVTVALHSCVDFGMQIPAIAATYTTLLGLGVAQSWSTRDKERN